LNAQGSSERGSRQTVSAVIPAYNEEETVGEVVARTLRHVDEVIVVDDGSTDDTSMVARNSGAVVVRNEANKGVLESLKMGFRSAGGEILVTLDADGQHDPDEIPGLLEPILDDRADLVLGARAELPHFSERVIARLTGLKVDVSDASTGFRAIRRNIVDGMELHGACTCGTFVLEAYSLGARIAEVPITVGERKGGKRRIKTRHFRQIFYVLYDLLRY
jgi:glycosyltransferase involved in cell wall biosynthesis